jgi:poly(A) polymerase
MIKRFVESVQDRVQSMLGRKPRLRKTPRRYAASDHGIDRAKVSKGALRTCETLQGAGFRAYIVGGAVRDLLLGLTPKDFDVATDATPEQVRSHFRRAIIIGRRFRLVHVMFGAETIETSTFRSLGGGERETDAHGRVLADNVFGEQHEDAARRDFTVNALYYDPGNGEVLDYHSGVADLRKRRLRIIGEPELRYREDPVRMLRVVRFAAKLGFEIDASTREPIGRLAALIENVPAARLFDEMLKLLTSGHSVACIERLRAEGLHHGLLPLLDVILEQPLGERFVMLALSRTDERVRAGRSIAPGFLFATLLWNEVLARWNTRVAAGEQRIPALDFTIDEVLDTQAKKLALQRRYCADMREIWMLQPRFERRQGSAPARLLEHLRFRAGYDFLLLRCDCGEVDSELGRWWTEYQDADDAGRTRLTERAAAPAGAGATAASKRRRRGGRGRSRREGDAEGSAGEAGARGADHDGGKDA